MPAKWRADCVGRQCKSQCCLHWFCGGFVCLAFGLVTTGRDGGCADAKYPQACNQAAIQTLVLPPVRDMLIMYW